MTIIAPKMVEMAGKISGRKAKGVDKCVVHLSKNVKFIATTGEIYEISKFLQGLCHGNETVKMIT